MRVCLHDTGHGCAETIRSASGASGSIHRQRWRRAGTNPWWTKTCEEAVREKRTAFKAWMRHRTGGDQQRIAEAHALYKQAKTKFNPIVPIPKPGKPRADPSNYRPISLTPHLGKLYERILKSRLEHHCESRGVIPLCQAGFRRGRGVTDHAVRLASHVKKALSRRHSTLATFCDIHRAYDSVWHYKLIEKLKKIAVSGIFLNFVKSFLNNRSFRVQYKGVYS